MHDDRDPMSRSNPQRADPLTAKAAVVVLCFNEQKWLENCISSVLATKDSNFRVFLVDNASNDRSAEFMERSF
jgi:glycosyltransferase involved in cell wall biosynthesis